MGPRSAASTASDSSTPIRSPVAQVSSGLRSPQSRSRSSIRSPRARTITSSLTWPRLSSGGVKRYHLTTFGCQMNEHDSERMKGMLESLGYDEVEARESADLILFNTCSIREKADNRLVGHLGEAKRLKREDP